MELIWLLAASAFVLSAILVWQFSNLARSRQIFMPAVRGRDVHCHPTPRVGGIAVVAAFIIVTLIAWAVNPGLLTFTADRVVGFAGFDRNLLGLILATVILVAVHARDDWREIHWGWKLVAQLLAAALIVSFGIRIQMFSNPFGSPLDLGALSAVFVVVWLVTISNVMNWVDSIDGLAGGVAAIALGVLIFLSLTPAVNQNASALLGVIALGAVLGFLPFNFAGRVFLGDAGAVWLGFIIGVLAIISGGKVVTAFLVLAIPFLDAAVVTLFRLSNRVSPFQPDNRHLSHRLLALGFKKYQVLLLFYAVSLIFGLIALNTQTLGKFWAILLALAVMTALVALYSRGRKDKTGS